MSTHDSSALSGVRAVTFDFWNTLIAEDRDPWGWKATAFADALRAAGHDVQQDRFASAIDNGRRLYDEAWTTGRVFSPQQWVDSFLAELDLSDDDNVRSRFVAILSDGMPAEFRRTAPNIAEVLGGIAAMGLPIGIICDVGLTPSVKLRSYLAHFGLLERFSHWSFSDEVGVFKPDPVIFHHAADGLGVSVDSILHIGDLRRTDVAGARAIGATPVRYAGLFDDRSEFADADHVIGDHLDLLRLLGPIQ